MKSAYLALPVILLALPMMVHGEASITSQPSRYDVVVIGGTPAGIVAGIAAASVGKSVVIIEQGPVPGGALSSGVLRLDDQYIESNTGVIEEFRKRIW